MTRKGSKAKRRKINRGNLLYQSCKNTLRSLEEVGVLNVMLRHLHYSRISVGPDSGFSGKGRVSIGRDLAQGRA